ncbi:MAG: Hpt domain-containing protein [Candidatus Nitrotoga sp.]|nr:Hpt domain-containing protein [Candidatus Nitrotoga sp.]
MADPNELQAKLKILCDAYATQLPEKLKHLEQVWKQLPLNSWDEEGFQTLHRMVHSLTGSGKTFGFSLLSDVARNLEEHLQQLAQAKISMTKQQRSHIHGLMSELHQVTLHRDEVS